MANIKSADDARAKYAQRRRDKEAEIRESVKALLPESAFADKIEKDGDYNQSAKTFAAVKQHLEEISAEAEQSSGAADSARRPFQAKRSEAAKTEPVEEFRQLCQVATRLVQKSEERLQAGNGKLSAEMKSALVAISDQIIDTIEEIEKAPGPTEE